MIQGTALLRGDVPAPRFEPVEGYRFVHAAAFDREPHAVLEHDTLRTLFQRINVAELEFDPGFFHYDAEAQLLSISSTDLRPPACRRHTIAVSGENGLTLHRPRRVAIEGNLEHNLIAGGNEYDRGSRTSDDNILFLRESQLDRDFEFADPLNLDFRLQQPGDTRRQAARIRAGVGCDAAGRGQGA